MPWALTLRLVTGPQVLRIVRKVVSSAAVAEGASAADAFDVEVAVGEALANAHLHAYGGTGGPIKIQMEFDGLRLITTLSDRGEPVTEQPAVPQTLPAQGQGRGLYLVGQLMEEVEVIPSKSRRRGIAIRMVKLLR